MSKHRFDICIITDRESEKLDNYVSENLKDLKVIQCYNFSLKKYYKTNYNMTTEDELNFETDISFNVGFYENIIKNSEFIFFDESSGIFNVNYYMLHLGIAIGLNKPIFITDKDSDNKRGRFIFSYALRNRINNTHADDEIERKWLISEDLYNNLYNNRQSIATILPYELKITQFVDNNGIRYRKQNSYGNIDYIKCIKSNKDELTRFEIESLISKDIYESKLSEFKESSKYSSVINKERTKIVIKEVILELNRHKIGSQYFYTAEIEYPNIEFAKIISLSDIVKEYNIEGNMYEFTNSKEISNKTLMKLNARKKTEIEAFNNLVNDLCENCFVKIEK